MVDFPVAAFILRLRVTASRGGAAYFCGEPAIRTAAACPQEPDAQRENGPSPVPRQRVGILPAGRKGRISASLALDKAGL